MLVISPHLTGITRFCKYALRRRHAEFRRFSFSCSMSRNSETREISTKNVKPPLDVPNLNDLRFDRLQVPEKELIHEHQLEFSQFVAREAVIDEEYWAAAWLRAESHWEYAAHDRFIDSHKRKFAEQEFHAIKRRRTSAHGQKSKCIVTVSKEDKLVKRNVLRSVKGSLDLSLRLLTSGENFPGERVKNPPIFCSFENKSQNRYGYVGNLCVAKAARRQGIASNMLYFAIVMAKSMGIEDLYVHVHRNNKPAQELYRKLGFEIVEMANDVLSSDQTFLLCCKA